MASPFAKLRLNRKNSTASHSILDTQVPMTDDQVRAAWVAASWLIDYPSEALLEQLPNLDRLIAGLPDRPRQGLAALISTLRTGDIVELRSDYVEAARARGIAGSRVVVRPAFKNALVPFVTAIVPEVDVPAGFLVLDPPGGLLDDLSGS